MDICSGGRHYSRRQRAHIVGLTYARPDAEPDRLTARKPRRSLATRQQGLQVGSSIKTNSSRDRIALLSGILELSYVKFQPVA